MVLLAFAPLAFGSVHAWAYGIVWGMVWVLLAAWGVGAFLRARRSPSPWETGWVRAAFQPPMVLFAVWVLLQCVPLPWAVVGWVQPQTLEVRELTLPVTGWRPQFIPMTLYPKASWVGLFHLWSCAGVFYLTLYHLRTLRHLLGMAVLWVVLGSFESLYGLVEFLAGTHRIWWWTNPFGTGSVNGTFINRNHLAGYLEMTLLVTIGLILALRTRAGGRRASGWRGKVSRMARDDRWARGAVLFFSAVLMGAALLLSLSRGGSLALAAVLLPLSVLLLSRTGTRRYGVVGLAVFLGMVLYAAPLGLDALVGRFITVEAGLADRHAIWSGAWEMILSFPLVGSGWGTFEWVFPRFKDAGYGELLVDHAHSDWLELLGEAGFPGGLLVWAGVLLYLSGGLRAWRARRDPWAVWLGFGALAAMAVVGAHCVGEFLLHTQANALTLAALMAWGWAAMHLRRRDGEPERLVWAIRKVRVPPWAGAGAVVALASVHLLVGLGMARHLVAESRAPTEPNSTLRREQGPGVQQGWEALVMDPDNAQRWAWLAHEASLRGLPRQVMTWARGEGVRIPQGEERLPALGRSFMEEAIRRNPTHPRHWEQMAGYLALDPQARAAGLAERCLRTALFLEPANGRRHFALGHFLLLEGRIEEAEVAMAMATALSPGLRPLAERERKSTVPGKGSSW
jgi:O-antigen ligase